MIVHLVASIYISTTLSGSSYKISDFIYYFYSVAVLCVLSVITSPQKYEVDFESTIFSPEMSVALFLICFLCTATPIL
jgi:hypothetical protein